MIPEEDNGKDMQQVSSGSSDELDDPEIGNYITQYWVTHWRYNVIDMTVITYVVDTSVQ